MRTNYPHQYVTSILLVICLICPCSLTTANATGDTKTQNLDSLYQVLDYELSRSEGYIHAKNIAISHLKDELRNSSAPHSQFVCCKQLFQEYQSLNNDSALVYIYRCIQLAQKIKSVADEKECKALMAYQCSSTGLFAEALQILNSIGEIPESEEARNQYLFASTHLYGELAYYTKIPERRKQYLMKQQEYDELLYRAFPPTSDKYLQRKEMVCYSGGNFKGAIHYSNIRLSGVSENDRNYAVVAYYRYLDYRLTDRIDLRKYWLLKATICDIRNAVMDQGAMWELARILQQEGDLERSHRYIRFAWNCAHKFSTRVRSWQISPVMLSIDESYQQRLNTSNHMLTMYLVAISILVVILLCAVVYINRQRSRIAVGRENLRKSNEMLSDANGKLSLMNEELKKVNENQLQLNLQLSQANRVKEEYVGRFMSMCSVYIDRMDVFRKQVNRLVKDHEYQELYSLTRKPGRQEKQLDELYENFDSAFLHLFPNFISDFNKLLKPEAQMTEGEDGRLSTTLRIFALIRLGIDDSSKISEFLHCSANTIYNYRSRVRNVAIMNRDEFEQYVKKIGME